MDLWARLTALASDTGAVGTVLYVGVMVTRSHLIRILLGLTVVEAGVNLLIVAVGYRPEAAAPILLGGQSVGPMVDPIPQALVLTAIVIGVGVLALGLALAVRVFETSGSLDVGLVGEPVETGKGVAPRHHHRRRRSRSVARPEGGGP
jgi:multicomponent Na+:H+ antiporter subunit C